MMIFENGDGLADANSYASLERANAYHALRLNEAWSNADESKRNAALVRATDYIDAHYTPRFQRLTTRQALQWPTTADATVPAAVVNATIVLALYALAGPLSAPAERGIKSTTKALDGVGNLQTVYDDAPPADPYPAVSKMLADVATPRGGPSPIHVGRLIA